MKRETLIKHGWRKIASVAHANVLLRREIKQLAASSNRTGRPLVDHHRLLMIRPGVWFKFVRLRSGVAVLWLSEIDGE